jgi:hypothetical protein
MIHDETGISQTHIRKIVQNMRAIGMLTIANQRPISFKLRPFYPMPYALVERMQKNLANVPEEAIPLVWEHSYPLSRKTSVTDILETGKPVRSKFRIILNEPTSVRHNDDVIS